MRILSKYILREHIGPFLFGLAVITFILVVDFTLEIANLIIGRGVSAFTVLEIFFFNLGWIFALSIPMSVLVATLMAFGRLSGDNEITAIKSSGVSLYRAVLAPLIVALGLAFLLTLFNNYALPWTNHRARVLGTELGRRRPTLGIKEGIFINDYPGYSILVRKVHRKSSQIEGITIYEEKGRSSPRTILAQKGNLSFFPQGNSLTIDLYNGEIHEVNQDDPSKYRRLTFKKYTLTLKGAGGEVGRVNQEYRGDREIGIGELLRRAKVEEGKMAREREAIHNILEKKGLSPHKGLKEELLKQDPQTLSLIQGKERLINYARKRKDSYMVEAYKKFSIPFACLVFILIGAPLGVMAHKGGIGVGIGLSLGFFLLYWAFLIGGEELADRNLIPPFWAMWAPNLIIGGTGFYLLTRRVKETKFLSWLELKLKMRRLLGLPTSGGPSAATRPTTKSTKSASKSPPSKAPPTPEPPSHPHPQKQRKEKSPSQEENKEEKEKKS